MREANFIRKNRQRWQNTEERLKKANTVPSDELATMFTEITADLSYANTYYPESNTRQYLNQLAAGLHQTIYKSKKEKKRRYITFWTTELPLTFASAHRQMLYSLLFFLGAVLTGVVSAAFDETFPRLVLGDGYVNMTINNIRNNDPMAVYKQMGQTDMFFYISFNNIWVAFRTFITGLLASLGTVFILVSNGIMLGVFQYFFFEYNLLLESFLVIWIHGTLEISAIVIAGGAGLVLGNSLLFPGTYPRLTSLKAGARRGLKIFVGLVPVFLLAAVLESFVTRLTEMPDWLKLGIILLSFASILFYFVILPLKLKRQGLSSGDAFL